MSSLYLANDFTIKIIFPPNEGSARESWEEELNFVRILGLIERMQRRLAESEHSANEKCRNRLFRICQNFADADFNEMIIEAK